MPSASIIIIAHQKARPPTTILISNFTLTILILPFIQTIPNDSAEIQMKIKYLMWTHKFYILSERCYDDGLYLFYTLYLYLFSANKRCNRTFGICILCSLYFIFVFASCVRNHAHKARSKGLRQMYSIYFLVAVVFEGGAWLQIFIGIIHHFEFASIRQL